MKKKSVRLVKKNQSASPKLLTEVVILPSRNSSKTIRAWVDDFQQREQSNPLVAFDCLFKDALPEPDISSESCSATSLPEKDRKGHD
jgi:hypothetical protein